MRRAYTGQAAGNDLATLRYELRQQTHILVVDTVDLLDAELANLLAAEKLPAAFARSAGTAAGTWPAARSTRTAFTRAPVTPLRRSVAGCRTRCLRCFVCHDSPSMAHAGFNLTNFLLRRTSAFQAR